MRRNRLTSPRTGWAEWLHTRAINLQCNRAAKKGDRHHDAMSPFETDKDSFQALQDILLDPNLLAELKKGPRLGAKTRRYDGLDGGYFTGFYRLRDSALTDDGNDARRHQNGEALQGIELAKNVSGEKR